MSKTEIKKAFEDVITSLQKELTNQDKLVSYVFIEGKIEAYKDALNLISNVLPEDAGTAPTETEEAPANKSAKA